MWLYFVVGIVNSGASGFFVLATLLLSTSRVFCAVATGRMSYKSPKAFSRVGIKLSLEKVKGSSNVATPLMRVLCLDIF